MTDLVRSLRPDQWVKNLLVFAGLIFADQLRNPAAVATAAAAFAVFCLLSSAIYLLNDVRDLDADRHHPVKSLRPIAAGRVSPFTAIVAAVILSAAALGGAFWLDRAFGLIAIAYAVLQLMYTAGLKRFVILDVLIIAIGFVLRAAAGAAVIHVAFSHWLLVVTLLGALFLGLCKRRAEIALLAGGATGHRASLGDYSAALLDHLITIAAGATLLAYAFYTISPETVAKFGSDRLLLTLPFPIYGIFRYMYLVHRRDGGGSPSDLLITDRPLLACFALWVLAVVTILYGPWRGGL